MGFLRCVLYMAALSALSFVVGRVVPKRWFRFEKAPWRAMKWEQNGRIYQKIAIQHWQNKVPDMSRVFPKLIPAKSMQTTPDQARLKLMIQETCVAELIHAVLCVLGLALLWLWRGIGGALCCLVYVLFGNLPFILIQRYNRPRLVRLYQRREKQKEGNK